jgi:hypothetical protein
MGANSKRAESLEVENLSNINLLLTPHSLKIRTFNKTDRMNTTFGFLSLPFEMRINIYKYISPVNSDFSYTNYQGLYLSRKAVQQEMDTECPKAFQATLQHLPKPAYVSNLEVRYFDGIRYVRTPENFSHLSNLRVDVHLDFQILKSTKGFKKPEDRVFTKVIAPLLSCAVRTFSVYINTDCFVTLSDTFLASWITKGIITPVVEEMVRQEPLARRPKIVTLRTDNTYCLLTSRGHFEREQLREMDREVFGPMVPR